MFEVDDEIRVMWMLPLSDADIERKIREIVKAKEHSRDAGVAIRVNNGKVLLKGRFLDYRVPMLLKRKAAKIRGGCRDLDQYCGSCPVKPSRRWRRRKLPNRISLNYEPNI